MHAQLLQQQAPPAGYISAHYDGVNACPLTATLPSSTSLASLLMLPNLPIMLPFDAVRSYYWYPVVLPKSRLPLMLPLLIKAPL